MDIDGGRTPRNFAVVKGGYVLAANQNSDSVVSFRIDKESGRLTPTGHTLSLPKPVCVVPVYK
ncbi:beta-propeller fold lactonase family protein [Paenibacillus sp. JTLBN-2024]